MGGGYMRSLFPVILFMILLCGCMQLDTGSFQTGVREPEPTGINKINLASTGGNVQGESNDERISIIATRVSDISDRMEKIENRLNDMESSLYQKNEDFQQDMRSMISELNSRINQLSEIQNKTISLANDLVKSYQILNQNFLTLQQNFLELQKTQDTFQNEIEKNLIDSKLLAAKEIERISNEKTKVFIEELTKQAEINARQSDLLNQIEKRIDAIEKNNVQIEKNISNTLEKKLGIILDEITRHESVIRATNKKIEDENIRLSKRFDEGINKSFNDIDAQLKQKFSIIISELVRHESGIQILDNRIKNLEGLINVSSSVANYSQKIEDSMQQEKKYLEEKYAKEIEERMKFYARIKDILEDISKSESVLALYKAQITSLDSVRTETSIIPAYSYIIVKPGDTLSSIAFRYHTSVAVLKSINNLTSDRIYAGQYIKVPISIKK